VITVDYRLSDKAKFPAAINDAKAAIRFIKVNAAQYNLNSNKIALWGSSAGRNLAVLEAQQARQTISMINLSATQTFRIMSQH
jgi:acetyl esterase/lipase